MYTITCKYHAILHKELEHSWISVPNGGPGTNPLGILKGNTCNNHDILEGFLMARHNDNICLYLSLLNLSDRSYSQAHVFLF